MKLDSPNPTRISAYLCLMQRRQLWASSKRRILAAVMLGKRMDIDVNIIHSVFGKGEENLIDWLKRGTATYINEKKTLDFLHHSDLLSEALKNQESSSDATNLLKEIEKSYDNGKFLLTESKILTPVNKNTMLCR